MPLSLVSVSRALSSPPGPLGPPGCENQSEGVYLAEVREWILWVGLEHPSVLLLRGPGTGLSDGGVPCFHRMVFAEAWGLEQQGGLRL